MRLPDRPLRRDPLPFEIRAAVDFQSIEMAFEDGVDALLKEWAEVRDLQLDELDAQIRSAGSVEALSRIMAPVEGNERLLSRMTAVAHEGVAGVLEEAAAQGHPIASPPTPEDLAAVLTSRADATAGLLARSLSEAASRRAVSIAGTALSPDQVAADVRGYLEALSDTWLRDQFTGLLTQSMGAGRRATMAASAEMTAVYASALLDTNVCAPCLEFDGHEFANLEDAERQFPTGGNMACLGGPRCRCTLVASFGESPASVA